MLFTVFTATYNRGHLLQAAYEGLQQQTLTDFEWLIVDDGSTDDTAAIVEAFIAEKKLPIRFFRKENGGKHTAINLGVREARGELFFILDSDDHLPADALATCAHYYEPVRDNRRFGGVCGLKAHFDGRLVGRGPQQDVLDTNSLDLRYKHGVTGDLCEVFRTDVLREFPFPEVKGEHFCPEALVWDRIARKYILRVFNKTVYLCEYLDDGLTARIVRIRMESPTASMAHYAEFCECDVPLKEKVKACANYWRFRLCSRKDTPKPRPRLSPLWWWTFPIGWAMHLRDKKNV